MQLMGSLVCIFSSQLKHHPSAVGKKLGLGGQQFTNLRFIMVSPPVSNYFIICWA